MAVVTVLQAGRSTAGTRHFSFLRSVQIGTQCIHGALSPELTGQEVKLAGHLHLERELRMRGSTAAVPHIVHGLHTDSLACNVRPLLSLLVQTPPCGTDATLSSPIVAIHLIEQTNAKDIVMKF